MKSEEEIIDCEPKSSNKCIKNIAHNNCSCAPEKVSGEDIGLSIDLLLDNSDNLGEEHFYIPDVSEELIKNTKFGEKYYENFYNNLLKIFKNFADHQIDSQKYKKEENYFLKLISRDQLFVIKISTFETFYRKSISYIKRGKDVYIKATYFQINNVMINLSYNDVKLILHNLNPHYAMTHEWTKEYFSNENNIQIDYSEFDLDYYLEEDDNDWLNLEKNLNNIINNFISYLKQEHRILFSEF